MQQRHLSGRALRGWLPVGLALFLSVAGARVGLTATPQTVLREVPDWTLTLAPAVDLGRANLSELGVPVSSQAVPVGDLSHGAPPLNAVIKREIPSLWRLSLPAGRASAAGGIDVRCDVVAPDGSSGRLALRGGSGEEVPVRLTPSPASVVKQSPQGDEIEGGAVLEVDLSKARYAGTYTGLITVTVTAR